VHALAFQVFAQHVAGLLVFVEHGDARIVGAARGPACSGALAGAAPSHRCGQSAGHQPGWGGVRSVQGPFVRVHQWEEG
jgi:hypothetical protein